MGQGGGRCSVEVEGPLSPPALGPVSPAPAAMEAAGCVWWAGLEVGAWITALSPVVSDMHKSGTNICTCLLSMFGASCN